MAAEAGRVEAVPRRLRGYVAGRVVFDTVRGLYGWDKPQYPQYHIPLQDVFPHYLQEGGPAVQKGREVGTMLDLRVGEVTRPEAALLCGQESPPGLSGTVKFAWTSLDAWFEEDEEVFVHPRNPYVRIDALRSHRHVRVEVDGVVLAETRSPCLLFETGLPTRYYVDRTDVRFEHLSKTATQTQCPYKGITSAYWSATTPTRSHRDIGWSYDFPTDAARPAAGMVAFYNERVDLYVDGAPVARPVVHFR